MRWLQNTGWWVTICVFLLGGPIIGVFAGRLASRLEQEQAWAVCSSYVAEHAADLLRETTELSEELFHLRSFFEAQPGITRDEFRLYTSQILKSHPAIQSIEWAPRVTAGGRESFPILYAEPPGASVSTIGFDLSSERTRNAALTRAVQTREVSWSDPVELVQSAPGSRGLLALLPVQRGRSDTARAGGSAPDGVILLAVRVQSLRDDLLAHRRAQGTPPVQIDLFDDDVGGTPAVMGSLAGIGEAPSRPRRTFEEWLDVGGQRWRLVGWPSEAFLSQHLTKRPLALGITVLLFWESAGGLALLLLTRRKDATLRRQSRVHEAAVRSLAEGVIVADTQGRFLLFNPAAERILGMGRQEVGLLEWSRTYGCFYPDTRTPYPPEQLPLARALRGEETDEEMFIRNPRVPGGIWISVSGAPLRDERRGLDGGVVVIRDITAWKRSSEELRRLSSAVEQTADTVVITNRDGVIEYVNPAFEATTGYSREEVIGQTPRILRSGKTSPQQYEELWSTILAGRTFRAQIVNRKKNGDLYHAEQTITPIRAADGSIIHFVSVAKDMTDRFRRQAQEIEMGYASRIQQRLYPASAPRVPGYDIAGAVFPATATCGDYFDYMALADGGLGLVIGDVCGHGLGPALIMATTRSYLRMLSTSRSSPGQVFETINDALYTDLDPHDYVAMVLVRLDVGSRRFSYANAGHVSGYHLDPSGAVKTVLSSTGVPLGMFPGQTYGSSDGLGLEPGELVVLFTDGIPEAENPAGDLFGVENALEVIRASRHESAEEIVQGLCRAARGFVDGAPQQDDITVVVCKGEPVG